MAIASEKLQEPIQKAGKLNMITEKFLATIIAGIAASKVVTVIGLAVANLTLLTPAAPYLKSIVKLSARHSQLIPLKRSFHEYPIARPQR